MNSPKPAGGATTNGSAAETLPVQPFVAHLTVPNRVESVRPAAAFLVHTSRALGVPAASQPLFAVAVTEALANAVKHGRSGLPGDVITCDLELDARNLTLRVSDSGRGFVVPDPARPTLAARDVQKVPESGYGLPIIQTVFPTVRAIRQTGRFTLELCLPIA